MTFVNRRTPPAPSTYGRLVQLTWDALQAGGDEDEREPEVGPDARRRHGTERGARIAAAARGSSRPGTVAEPPDVGEHADDRVATGTTTSGWRPRRTWRPSTRRSCGRTPIPRRYLSASTASPTPSVEPDRHRHQCELDRDPECVLELDAAERRRRTDPSRSTCSSVPWASQRVTQPDRPAERVQDEHARITTDGSSISIAVGK